jgi:EmrB/QacA subfamily drug resistance transporter
VRNACFAKPGYKWWVLAVVQCSFMLVGVDSTIVNLALPTMAREMGASLSTAQWAIAAYFTTTAVVLPMMGRVADAVGLKTIFLVGFAVFTASSVGCGLAPNFETLIAMRIMQATGAAALLANSNVISLGVFPLRQHSMAMGINGTIFSLGFGLGYTLGGFLIEAWGWRSIFLINLPIGLAAMVLGMVVLVEEKIRPVVPAKVPFDGIGAGLSIVALALLMVSLDRMSATGGVDGLLLMLLLAAFVGLAVLVTVEKRSRHPMLDVSLFRNGNFTMGLVTRLMSNASFTACAFLIPFYTQGVLGFSPIESGLMMLPFALMFAVAGPISGRTADKIGPRALTVAGFLCSGSAFFVLSLLGHAESELRELVVQIGLGMALLGTGSGLFISPNSAVTLDAVPKDRAGAASGLLYFMAFLGSALGTAGAAAALTSGLHGHGGIAALHSETGRVAATVSFLDAQRLVFHLLIGVSVFGAVICGMRGRPHARPV